MLEKGVHEFEKLKISQILHADKTGFYRLDHKFLSKSLQVSYVNFTFYAAPSYYHYCLNLFFYCSFN